MRCHTCYIRCESDKFHHTAKYQIAIKDLKTDRQGNQLRENDSP